MRLLSILICLSLITYTTSSSCASMLQDKSKSTACLSLSRKDDDVDVALRIDRLISCKQTKQIIFVIVRWTDRMRHQQQRAPTTCLPPRHHLKSTSLSVRRKGTRIHLSRIDDGICDCCNGVDETQVQCEDRCSSILNNLKEKQRQLKGDADVEVREKTKMIESAVMMTSDRLLRFQFHQSLLRTLTSFRDRELGPRLQLETLIERHEHGLCAWYARSNRTCELEHEETQCPNVWSRDTFPKSKKAKRTFSSVWNFSHNVRLRGTDTPPHESVGEKNVGRYREKSATRRSH